jgi:hypothetical protein
LKRLGNIENELIEKYPDISFLFYDKADNIPDNEKKDINTSSSFFSLSGILSALS